MKQTKKKLQKILFYMPIIDGGGGGAERVMINLASQFADNGYDVTLLTFFPTKDLDKIYEFPKEIKWVVTKTPFSFSSTPFLLRIKRIFERYFELRNYIKKSDLVISFMSNCNTRSILAAFGLKAKSIISVRADPIVEYPGVKGWLYSRLLLPLADGCVFQTEDAKNWFSKKLQDKSAVIFNEVKPDFFNVERKPVNGEILSCGRLAEQKNHIMLIKAVNELHKKYPELKLKIYGEGELREELEELIKKLEAESFIKLMGWTKDIIKALETAEMFVLSSDFEGVSNALMEAMAAGLPCISTDCPPGGSKMLIENMQNGILIPVGDVKALEKNIEFLYLNKEKAKEIADNAKKRSLDFAPDKVFKEWEKYFESVINR